MARVRYSQEEMATPQNKNATALHSSKQGSQQGFIYLPLIAGWLVPGAGHFLLRKWGRGALLAVSVLGMFCAGHRHAGQALHERPKHSGSSRHGGDLGNGLLYIVSRAMGLGAEPVQVTTADYGTRFIVVAGLLNVIAAVDAHNLRTGRKL